MCELQFHVVRRRTSYSKREYTSIALSDSESENVRASEDAEDGERETIELIYCWLVAEQSYFENRTSLLADAAYVNYVTWLDLLVKMRDGWIYKSISGYVCTWMHQYATTDCYCYYSRCSKLHDEYRWEHNWFYLFHLAAATASIYGTLLAIGLTISGYMLYQIEQWKIYSAWSIDSIDFWTISINKIIIIIIMLLLPPLPQYFVQLFQMAFNAFCTHPTVQHVQCPQYNCVRYN